MPGPDARRRFLDERREICRQRFDSMHAPVYDDRWSALLGAGGFRVDEVLEGDGYAHFLLAT
jgi:hypothetical protein